VHAFRRRSTVVLLILAAIAPTPALAQEAEAPELPDPPAQAFEAPEPDDDAFGLAGPRPGWLQPAILRDLPSRDALAEAVRRIA